MTHLRTLIAERYEEGNEYVWVARIFGSTLEWRMPANDTHAINGEYDYLLLQKAHNKVFKLDPANNRVKMANIVDKPELPLPYEYGQEIRTEDGLHGYIEGSCLTLGDDTQIMNVMLGEPNYMYIVRLHDQDDTVGSHACYYSKHIKPL